MDVLERVREMNVNATPVSATDINAARQRLLREIAKEGRAQARGRRRWIGGTALVGGVAATVVAINVLAPARIDPAAAAVLEDAAAVTINAIDTTLSPGQYLRIQTDSDTLWKWDAGMGDEAWERFNNGNRDDAEAGIVVQDTRVLYVPADRSSDWIWDWSATDAPIATYGDRADEAVADWETQARESDSGYWPDIQALPGGEVRGAGDDPNQYLLDSYREFYADMPRDPQALLGWFRAHSGDPDVSDQWVVSAIADTLSANLMPADLRAATLRALALVPGIRVADINDDQATLEYTSGDWLSSRSTQITIDTTLGMIIAVSESDTNKIATGGSIPSTVADTETLVTTTVVDSAPKP